MNLHRGRTDIMSIFSALILCAVCAIAGEPQAVIHVAPGGDDAGSGMAAAPLASLKGARDKVRAILVGEKMTGDIEVRFSAGDYIMTAPVEFSPEDSGREGHRVIYRNADAIGSARFMGGRKLAGGWEKVDDTIWKIALPQVDSCHTLYENGKRLRKARHPNYLHDEKFPTAAGPYFTSLTGSNKEQATDTESWIIAREVDLKKVPAEFGTMKINIFPWGKCDWHRWICSVTEIDLATRKITFANDGDDTPMVPSAGAMTAERTKARYFLEEHREFLDVPGEFYFDSTAKVLYLIPHSAEHPDKLDIVLPVLQDIVRFEGSSHDDPVHDIELEGLTLEYSKAISPSRFWWAQEWGYTDHALVWMNNTKGITIRNCHLKNSGRSGIMMVGQNTDNLVYGCWIEQMGVNGITLSNWSAPVMEKSGDAARIEHNVLSNNKIHDVGQLAIYCAGINIYSASHNVITHNEIFRSPRYAITMRGNAIPESFTKQTPTRTAHNRPPSEDNVFEYLRIYDCSQDSGDSGAMHAALVNDENGPCLNTFRQITMDNTRAAPHMKDHVPNAIFLDWKGRTMHQRFIDIQAVDTQGQAFRSNGSQNEDSAYFENVSWGEHFDPSHMEYLKIGLKKDFPDAYGGSRDSEVAVPPVIRNFKATPTGVDSITLNWDPPAGDYASDLYYTIYRGDNSLATTRERTYVDDRFTGELQSGSYRVMAQNGRFGPVGKTSETVTAKTLPDTTPPGLASARYNESTLTIVVAFTEAVDETTAVDISNYALSTRTKITRAQSVNSQVYTLTLKEPLDWEDGVKVLVRRIKDTAASPNQITEGASVALDSLGDLKVDAYYRMDESKGDIVTDSSGNGSQGKLFGNHAWSRNGGKSGGALELDGKTAYAECPPEVGNFGTGDFTILAWIYKNAAGSRIILAKGNGYSSANQWSLGMQGPNNSISLRSNNKYWNTAKDSVTTDQWHHIAFVREGNRGYTYVDGVSAGEPQDLSYLGDLTNELPLLIGRRGGNEEFKFDGLLDEIIIFRKALSPAEIAGFFSGIPF